MSSPRNCVRPTWLLLAASLSALNFVGALGCGDHDGHDQKCTPKTCEALGAKCGQLSDGCSATLDCGSCTAPETCGGGGQANVCGIGLTPDPVTVAPKLDPTVATDIADSTAFLYTGDHPIQVGVAAGTIEKRRVVVIRGSVEDRDGQPMPEVTVAFLGHPELGHTSTRADGMYDLAANGGGLLTLTLEKAGFLTSQRAVQTPWRDFVWAPKVTLVPLDANVTTVDLSAPGLQVARGSVVTDEDGSRQATVLVPAGTAAEMVLPDGSKQSLTTLHLRATEYTVGEAGPEAMPAPLPPSSGYTYAVELSADEAVGARATNLRFSQPVVVYVENFLGFPVGGVVPVGYYDRQEGQWVASSNGRVIKVVGVASGMADLDLDGDGAIDGASSLSTLGITDDERTRLARLYPTGQSLWRVAISHFTPLDLNWAYGPPRDATPPPDQDPEVIVDDPDKQCGSIIGCQDQTLGEVLPVAGTPFSLHYKSDRTRGRKGAYSLEVQLSKGNTPATLSRIRVEVRIAGRLYQAAYAPAPSLKYSLEWDGKDAYGRIVQGSQPADVRLYYDYAPVYYPVSQVANSFARAEAIAAASPFSNVRRAASTFTLAKNWTRSVGAWDARGWGLGGWGLSVQHAHDSLRHNLLLGNGDDQSERSLISTIAGTGTYVSDYTTGLGDGGPAIAASFGNPSDVAVGPDGSLYVSDGFAGRVRRVAPDGIISNFAGDGSRLGTGYGGDGGLATAAALNYPSGLALGRDGSVYIADSHNDRIRRVGPDGIITTVAGIGTKSCGAFSCIPAVGDGGPAIAAELNSPRALALGPDGSLYVAEMYDRIRRVGTDGIITTVAGTGTEGYGGDGGPATEALLYAPRSMAIGPDGSLFIADSNNFRIRRVGTDGIITTVAGTGASGYSGEGGPATAAMLNWPSCVAVGPDGSLFIADSGSGSTDWTHDRIRRVGPDGIITTIAGTGASGFGGDGGLPTAAGLYDPRGLALAPDGSLYIADRGNLRIRRVAPSVVASSEVSIASANGAEVFVFTSSGGRHIKTLDSLAGASRYELGYDAGGYLTSVTDSAGNVTTIERTGATATAIVAPFGQHTVLSVNPDGWLTGLTDPAGLTRVMDYSADGLLQHFTDPLGQVHSFTYNDAGRLIKDEDPAGGSTSLARTEQAAGYTVTTSTALGRTHVYQVESLTTGGNRRTITDSNVAKTVKVIGTNGSEQTTNADGSSVLVKKGPDPRWGMVAPIAQSVVTKTPAGLTNSVTATRSVNLSVPASPWSMTKLTDTVSVNGKNWLTSYDASTRKVTSKSPVGRQSVVTLDEKGRVVTAEVAGLAPVTIAYDEKGRPKSVAQAERSTAFGYDALGYLSSITDPLSRVVGLQSDSIGRLTLQTGPDNGVTQFRYDANSNIAGLTPPGRSEYGFGYTAVDLESSFTPPSVGPWSPTTSYSYDKDKALASVARPDGVSVTMTYDAAGRVSQIDHPRGPVKLGYSSTTGQLVSAETPEESLGFAYDGSLLTGATWSGAVAGKVAYAYDNSFRLTSTMVNGANAASRGYDDDGLLTNTGGLTLSRDPGNGLLAATAIGTGAGAVTESFGYNTFGEVTSYTAKAGSTSLLAFGYTRDALGRISAKDETIGGTPTAKFEYGYDAANRLVEVKKDGVVVRGWTYDAAGNRTSATEGGATVSATYDAQDRLVSYGTTTYTFGNAGDLQSRQRAGETPTQYVYDALGSLVAATLPDGRQLAYVVDAQGRRVGKKVNGVLTQSFLWESQLRIAAELDGSGNVVSRFVYGTKVNVPELIVKGTASYRVITDHLGSPRLVVDTADGTVAQRIEYDEWGNVTSDSNPGFQPFGFAGGQWDRDTRLVRFGVRDYDAAVGRWANRDPIGFGGRDGNLYSYCANDAVNELDATGQLPLGKLAKGKLGRILAVLLKALGNVEKMEQHIPQYKTPGDPAEGIERARKAMRKASTAEGCGGGGSGGGKPPPPSSVDDILELLDSLDETDLLNLLNPVPWMEYEKPFDPRAPLIDKYGRDHTFECARAGWCA